MEFREADACIERWTETNWRVEELGSVRYARVTFPGANGKGLTKTTANLVLQSTTERIFATLPPSDAASQPRGVYADIHHGIFLVRGENVLLLGEIDLDRDDEPPRGYERGEVDVVKKLAEEQKKDERGREKRRLGKLAGLGFEGEGLGDMVL